MFPLSLYPSTNRVLHQIHVLIVPLVAMLLATSALAFTATGPTQAAAVPPWITSREFLSPSGLISIEGDGFTPGGRVQVLVVDQWGNTLHEPVWTMAAGGGPFSVDTTYDGIRGYGNPGAIDVILDLDIAAIYGPNGSQDPANGYQAGVNGADLGNLGSVRIRAFDEYSGIWSNVADVDTASSLESGENPQIQHEAPQACVVSRFCQTPF